VPGGVLGATLPVTPAAIAHEFRCISLTARCLQGLGFAMSRGDPIVAKGLFANGAAEYVPPSSAKDSRMRPGASGCSRIACRPFLAIYAGLAYVAGEWKG
jgi:hypothetical protein